MIELKNGRVSLALHALSQAEGAPLLLLHELGGASDEFRGVELAWPGPVYALDLSGHGYSGRVHGGAYYPEMWAADADAALVWIAEHHRDAHAVLLGRGVGAYVALLLAGARPARVSASILCAGRGLFGSDSDPTTRDITLPDVETRGPLRGLQASSAADPVVSHAQDHIARPADYAARFARLARRIVLVEDGAPRPAWWSAIAAESTSVRCTALPDALAHATC